MGDGGVKVLKERLEKFFHRVRPYFSGTYSGEIKCKNLEVALTVKHRQWERCSSNTRTLVTNLVGFLLMR